MLSMDSFVPILEYRPGYKHHWIYFDNGIPVMVVARYDNNDEKTYRQFCQREGEWVEGMPPSPYPLFGLHSLTNKSPIAAVIICEGEKCAAVVHQLGWPAVAAVLGAQNPASSDWAPLRHFTRFIILRDNDKAGIAFARAVSTQLYRLGSSVDIQVVNLSPDHPDGDLIDWLQSTVLLGRQWDGFNRIPDAMVSSAAIALRHEIECKKVSVECCPQVAFKPVEARFEGDPKPLEVNLRVVLPFPIEVFPPRIKEFLEVTSTQFSQIPDFASTAFLAAVGGLIGRSIHLHMRSGDSWYETTNLWCILVGPPSAMKSPIRRRIFSLFKPLEENAAEAFRILDKEYKAKKYQAEKDKKYFDEPAPVRRRYITDDITMPKLRELMAGNPRGLILRNDELKGQLERLDKIGSEGDRSFMMSCWSGLEAYTEDRMCRDSLLNIDLALTWIGCIPPTALQHYLREAMGRGGGADGFMQRFQFICFPDHQKRYVLPTEALSSDLTDQIQKVVGQLDTDANGSPRTLSFCKETQNKFDEWLVRHGNNVRSGLHPIYWESHLGKQSKALAVLIIILHRLTEVIDNRKNVQVSLPTLEGALKLLDYFEAHARRCYDSVVGCTIDDAKTILALLQERRLSTTFKAQDIYHIGLGGLSDSAKVKTALELLQDYGWVISEKVPAKTGRKPEFWILHPRAFKNMTI